MLCAKISDMFLAMTFVAPFRRRLLALLPLSLCIAGCASTGASRHQATQTPATATARDYSQKEVGLDSYSLQYIGRGRHPKGYVEDLLMLRAAQLTIEHGYSYFAIVAVGPDMAAADSATARAAAQPGASSAKTGPGFGLYGSGLSAFGSASMIQAPANLPPGAPAPRRSPALTIRCFKQAPVDVIASNAANVERLILKKYEADPAVTTAQL